MLNVDCRCRGDFPAEARVFRPAKSEISNQKSTILLMHRIRLTERERGDLGVEPFPVLRDHLVSALHHAERRREWTARRVFERLPGLQGRLFTHYARAPNFFDVAGTVGDDPVPG